MTRDEARQAGLKRYFPEKPCLHGHAAERYVGNNDCVECSKQRAQRYAEEHREEARLRADIWRNNNLERHRQNARNSAARDPQRNRDKARAWALANPERAKEGARKTYQKNRGRYKAQATAWAKANPGKRKSIMASNRAQRESAKIPLSAEHHAWLRAIYENCPPGLEVDQIFPINHKQCSGLHVPWNLQYLDPIANREKSNKLPANARGFAFDLDFIMTAKVAA